MRPTLYTASWVVPVSSPPLRNAAVLVDADGRIESVAPVHTYELSSEVARVDLGEAVIMPGLVNVHAHPELAAFRGLLEDMPFHQWIPTLMRCKRGAQLNPGDYDTSARWTCAESLRAGVTTLGATEDSGSAVAALNDAGMRGVVFLEVFGPAPAQAAEAIAELQAKVATHTALATERVQIGVSPHAPYTVSDDLYRLTAQFARAEKLPVATHAAEAEAEDLLVRSGEGPFAAGLRSRGITTSPRGRSTVDMLARTGILECAPLLIHAVRIDEDDLQLIADAGASIAHCPVANGRLGHGIAPIVEALEMGVRVAMGTDSVASNNRLDVIEEAHIAQTLQRARLRTASSLPSAQLLRMVTIDAAEILGLSNTIGTLEQGKSADLCVIDLSATNTVPVVDPVSAIFHSARGSDVVMTSVGGRVLYQDGEFFTLNVSELATGITAISGRLCAARDAS